MSFLTEKCSSCSHFGYMQLKQIMLKPTSFLTSLEMTEGVREMTLHHVILMYPKSLRCFECPTAFSVQN